MRLSFLDLHEVFSFNQRVKEKTNTRVQGASSLAGVGGTHGLELAVLYRNIRTGIYVLTQLEANDIVLVSLYVFN
jgi:hypothetical protein